jgi:hypothetical protein
VVSAIQTSLVCIAYTSSNGNTAQYESERMCKESIVAHFKILLRHVSARTLKTVSSLRRIRSPGRDLNSGPPEYKETVITRIQ